MQKAANKNAPNLWGWVIGIGAGIVAFGAVSVVGDFDLTPAAAVGGVVALAVGLFLGMPWGASDAGPSVPAPAVTAPTAKAHAPVTAPVAAPVAAPLMAAPTPTEGPARLSAPRGGVADDLKVIEGIGPAMERLVNEMGFFHIDQIAGWSDADVAWVDANLKGFKGRVTRDRWVAQARIITTEGLEAFRLRARTNDY